MSDDAAPTPWRDDLARHVGVWTSAAGDTAHAFEADDRFWVRVGDGDRRPWPHGVAATLLIDGTAFAPHAVGAPVDHVLYRPVHPVAELRRRAEAARPPVQPGPFARPDLVDLRTVDETLRFDVRYATERNFVGTAFYDRPAAYLQRPAAEALAAVQRRLARGGVGLVVYDAYRPWAVTKMFWDASPPDRQAGGYVANPARGSRHNRGCAVDVGLVDLDSGDVLAMPSGYDEFSPRAAAAYFGGTTEQRRHRALLQDAMVAEGFELLGEEWWHFDYAGWERYPVLNTSFAELEARAARRLGS